MPIDSSERRPGLVRVGWSASSLGEDAEVEEPRFAPGCEVSFGS